LVLNTWYFKQMEKVQTKNNTELESKKLQLHWLLQITKAINYNLDAGQLYKIYENVLQQHLQVGKAALYVHEDVWKKIVEFGFDGINEINPEVFLSNLNSLNEKKITAPDWLKKDESVIPVYHNNKLLANAIIGNIEGSEDFSKREILPFIHTITNIIVVAIENKRLTKESIAQAALRKELELAAEVQEMLIPSQLDTHERMQVDAFYLPHQQVGGDYYDFIKVNDDEFILCMADVSGKGMAAALLMANFQANMHALVNQHATLVQIVTELNKCVNKIAKGEKFITFFIAHINLKQNSINYINAGHNPPLFFDGKTHHQLDKGSTGLGMFDELPFINEGQMKVTASSILFCYTDGITDVENKSGEYFGLENLQTSLGSHHHHELLDKFHHGIIKTLDDFRTIVPYTDDVTMLTCRFV
jgi:phosphoserine phosphatase RsbU/P